MKSLSQKQIPEVAELPTPSEKYRYSILTLLADDKPYWCDGTTWYPMLSSSSTNMVVSSLAPSFPAGQNGLWIQTGLGPTGDDFTFWFEDGV